VGTSDPVGEDAAPDRVVRPSTRWYWVGAILVVGGSVAGIILLAVSLSALEIGSDAYPRIDVPGETQLQVDLDGEYILHGETRHSGGPSDTLDPPVVTVRGPDDRPVSVRSTTVSPRRSYVEDGRDGFRFGSFIAHRPGRYVVSVRERTEADPEPRTQSTAVAVLAPAIVAVESPIRASAVAGVIGGGSLFVLSWLVGFLLMFVTLLRRGTSYRRLVGTSAQRAAPPRGAGSAPGPAAGAVARPKGPPASDPWRSTGARAGPAEGASAASARPPEEWSP
jgi:hypothetical protein